MAYDPAMKFTKMHGLGNDYVYVNGFAETVADPKSLAVAISDRHTGVGSDGLILILPSEVADVAMRMFNADGSESEMCGNGIRCVAKYAHDHGLTDANPMRVETGRGVLELRLELEEGRVERVTVDMGEPILDLAKIPVDHTHVVPGIEPHSYKLRFSDRTDPTLAKSRPLAETAPPISATFVSMGNPHAVIFVSDIQSPNIAYLGPLVERHIAFPKRINAHWVQVIGRDEVIMRTWERGSGITQACGTGACAVCVAGALMGKTDRRILAHLPGGDMVLDWRESDNAVAMTGPATEVFSGEYDG